MIKETKTHVCIVTRGVFFAYERGVLVGVRGAGDFLNPERVALGSLYDRHVVAYPSGRLLASAVRSMDLHAAIANEREECLSQISREKDLHRHQMMLRAAEYSVKDQAAFWLSHLAKISKDSTLSVNKINFSQLLACSREMIGRVFSELEQEGYLRQEGMTVRVYGREDKAA